MERDAAGGTNCPILHWALGGEVSVLDATAAIGRRASPPLST
jgi:hypothetical protein